MTYDVTLIPGDGIGPEITAQTVRVLEATGLRFNWDEELAGMAAVEATGTPLPDATVESIRKNQLALKGPLTTPVGTGFRSVNVGLRKEFELFANVRPARSILPGGRFDDIDIVIVRENLEGLYIGVEHFVQIGDDPRAVAESMAIVTRAGCERIIRYAFETEALIYTVIASVVAYAVNGLFVGWSPIFFFPQTVHFTQPIALVGYASLGVVAGVIGAIEAPIFYAI
jgi:isocitrate dehydrogenase (NAD+)